MNKIEAILVFAGNFQQFKEWVSLNLKTDRIPRNVIYASSEEKTLGFNNVLIIKTGDWYRHKWAKDAIIRLEQINRIDTNMYGGEVQ